MWITETTMTGLDLSTDHLKYWASVTCGYMCVTSLQGLIWRTLVLDQGAATLCIWCRSLFWLGRNKLIKTLVSGQGATTLCTWWHSVLWLSIWFWRKKKELIRPNVIDTRFGSGCNTFCIWHRSLSWLGRGCDPLEWHEQNTTEVEEVGTQYTHRAAWNWCDHNQVKVVSVSCWTKELVTATRLRNSYRFALTSWFLYSPFVMKYVIRLMLIDLADTGKLSKLTFVNPFNLIISDVHAKWFIMGSLSILCKCVKLSLLRLLHLRV